MRRVRHALQKYGDHVRFATLPAAIILLLVGARVNGWIVFSGVVMAIVAVHMVLRLFRGPVRRSEEAFAKKLGKLIADASAPATDPALREPRARLIAQKGSRNRQSRHARHFFKFKDKQQRLLFDADEAFVVELRRHPLSMLAPLALMLVVWTVVKAIGALIMFMVKAGWAGLAMFCGLIVLGVLAYEIRYVLLGIVLGISALIIFVWTRYWLVQTIVITTRHVIVFSKWRTKKPWIIDLPMADEVSGSYSGPAKALTRTRFTGLAWGSLTYAPKHVGGRLAVSRPMPLMKGVPGAEVLAGMFPKRGAIRKELPPAQ